MSDTSTPRADAEVAKGGGEIVAASFARTIERALTSVTKERDEALRERDERKAINTNYRLFDLVRCLRADLHDAELITDEEYAWLCAEAPMATNSKGGSPSRKRLEDYDALRARVAELENERENYLTELAYFRLGKDELIADNATLRAKVAELQADKERMDWLESEESMHFLVNGPANFRSAIDAALKEKP